MINDTRIEECQADDLLKGPVLVLSPHLDDEILGCGHALRAFSSKQHIHVAYCTAGDRLPAGVRAADNPDLARRIGDIRKQESLAAIESLGLNPGQTRFLDLPELEVARNKARLAAWLKELLDAIRPNTILAPFRFDQHPDHLALNRAIRRLLREEESPATLLEYFIYSHYPLLPGKDIRLYCNPLYLRRIAPDEASKRAALLCFHSQASCYFIGQTRPVLTGALIAERSAMPEFFLAGGGRPDHALLTLPACIPSLLQRLQPTLKRMKEFLRTRLGIRREA